MPKDSLQEASYHTMIRLEHWAKVFREQALAAYAIPMEREAARLREALETDKQQKKYVEEEKQQENRIRACIAIL